MSRLGVAFKEWAVICEALAAGRQAILLRKGGVAEAGDAFRVEHERFWLYPTFVHQQEAGIVESARPLLETARADRPPAGMIRLSHFAEVTRVHHLDDLEKALGLSALHVWSPATVEARFRYRTPGLFVLAVRVYRAKAHPLAETAAYAGCKSWVELSEGLETGDAEAVLDGARLTTIVNDLDRLLV